MSTIKDRLENAAFPEDYAGILADALGITPGNFLNVKDTLYHFRRLDESQAAEVMGRIAARDRGANPYSVLLLYPEYANDTGYETYYAFVEAPGPAEAVAAARRKALAAQDGVVFPPDDFLPLLVTAGYNYGEPLPEK
jgi:hypothetical protein